ncbi:hypothetical protein SAMN05444392_101691 [Seinonella peptonophila]|uniref:Uncharacterized protein n=1 Tax=Seinonella peptonophila TaxID=112248 RepID=A0A1M4TX63_9BACL|nr:hypothetical protein [Seinonella peptonophila]SHE49032.1 hypothetical protein SAMN05444392_101691 [Seinonella peptonophila]
MSNSSRNGLNDPEKFKEMVGDLVFTATEHREARESGEPAAGNRAVDDFKAKYSPEEPERER